MSPTHCLDCTHPATVHYVRCGVGGCSCSDAEFERTELTALRQQVADLRAALEAIRRRNHAMHHFLPEPCPDGLCAEYDRVLAATQPQEVH